jgi:hypothetical protein
LDIRRVIGAIVGVDYGEGARQAVGPVARPKAGALGGDAANDEGGVGGCVIQEWAGGCKSCRILARSQWRLAVLAPQRHFEDTCASLNLTKTVNN